MLTIEQLSLTLPAGFESRSDEVLRIMADELMHLGISYSGAYLRQLQLAPLEMQSGWTNHELARHIVHAIHDGVRLSIQEKARHKGGLKR